MKYKYLHGKITSDVMFEAYGKSEKETRIELATLLQFLKEQNLTVVLIDERETADDKFTFEDFLADTVVMLRDYPSSEERKSGITVLKMRGSRIDRTTRPYFITEKGIVVYPTEHLL